MKKSLLIAVLATLPLSMPLAWADEVHHSDKDKKPATVMTDKDKQMQMGKMQESMLKMHEQMHKIMDAKNPQEREELVQTHRELMRQHMQSMKDGGMVGQGMTGGAANSGSEP